MVGSCSRAGAAVIAAALIPVLALALTFPEGGTEPFAFSSLWFAHYALAALHRLRAASTSPVDLVIEPTP